MISAFHTSPPHPGTMNTDTASPARRRLAIACLFAGAALASAGCATRNTSSSGLLEPYRTGLPQGNYLTREQVDQVREGMTRDQVRFLLGTPLLGHIFHTDRWDYVFSYRHPSGQTEIRSVTVRFANDRVSSVQADPLPLREDPSDPALPGFRPPAETKKGS